MVNGESDKRTSELFSFALEADEGRGAWPG